MELIITIPKEFEAHFKQDKFKDSLGRICYDIENAFKKQEGVSGRYEHELAEMLDDAFAKAQVSPIEAKLKRELWLARANAAKNMKEMWDATTDTGNLRSRKGPAWIKTGKRLEVSEWRELWSVIETKCRAYADKFKEET